MKILTAQQMAEVDRRSWELYRIPTLLLMESAGRAVADELEKAQSGLLRQIGAISFAAREIMAATAWLQRDIWLCEAAVRRYSCSGDPANLKGDALTNWEMVRSLDIKTVILSQASGCRGTAQEAEVSGRDHRRAIRHRSFEADRRGLPPPDRLDEPGAPDVVYRLGRYTVRAVRRFRCGSGARGQSGSDRYFYGAQACSGRAAGCGSAPEESCRPRSAHPPRLLQNPEYRMNLIDAHQARGALPPRARDSHKGSFGHVFVVAGSRGKSGAALMTGLAALRSGAGLVTLYLPRQPPEGRSREDSRTHDGIHPGNPGGNGPRVGCRGAAQTGGGCERPCRRAGNDHQPLYPGTDSDPGSTVPRFPWFLTPMVSTPSQGRARPCVTRKDSR